jgi:CRISPR-associated protein Cas2
MTLKKRINRCGYDKMVFLIMYDIAHDKCRLAIADYLEGKGRRVQESVFECAFTGNESDQAVADLEKILGDRAGNIRAYPVCAECYAKTIGIGDIGENGENRGYAVF